MIARSHTGKNPQEKTVRQDLSPGYDIALTVLYREESVFKRDSAEGKVLSIDKSEIEISTSFPLKANQVLYWADRHKKDNFHLAIVRWSKKSDDAYRVGLSILS
jgi:hypothetical protein